MNLDFLSRDNLTRLIRAYDMYISDAKNRDLFKNGWRPVDLEEFSENAFLTIKRWRVFLAIAWSTDTKEGTWETLEEVVTGSLYESEEDLYLLAKKQLVRKLMDAKENSYTNIWLRGYCTEREE